MGHTVLLKQADGQFIARVPGLPECTAQGATRQETLEKVRTAIAKVLEGTEVLTIETDTPHVRLDDDPWIGGRDMFRDDPDYGLVLKEIAAYRKQADEECPAA